MLLTRGWCTGVVSWNWPWVTPREFTEIIGGLMTHIDELLTGLGDKIEKAKREIQGELDRLAKAVEAGRPSKEILDHLQELAQSLDDIVPDAPQEPGEGEDAGLGEAGENI